MNPSGKNAFVTGGSRGIGRALCDVLLSKGAKVLFCSLNLSNGKNTEAELQKQYGVNKVCFSQCDVTDAEQLKASFQEAVDKFGRVDICVNNAGIMDERIWEKMIEINTVAQIRGSLLALEHMRKDKGGAGGVIFNISSIAGTTPMHYFPMFVASKFAIVGFTNSWAVIDTEMLKVEDDQLTCTEEFRQFIEDSLLDVAEVAEGFLRLLNDEKGVLMEVVPLTGDANDVD